MPTMNTGNILYIAKKICT